MSRLRPAREIRPTSPPGLSSAAAAARAATFRAMAPAEKADGSRGFAPLAR